MAEPDADHTHDDATRQPVRPAHAVHLSRRGLLKGLGVTLLGSVAGTLAIPRQFAVAATAAEAKDAWAIAAASPILQRIVERAQAFAFAVSLEEARFQVAAERGDLVGLLVRQATSPSLRTSLDIVATVDIQRRVLTQAQYGIGWSLDCSLEVRSVVLNEQSLQLIDIGTRTGIVQIAGPQQETAWSFARPRDDIPPPPEFKEDDSPEDPGWGPDIVDARRWFYSGCSRIAWDEKQGSGFLCTQVTEYKSADPTITQVFDLTYE